MKQREDECFTRTEKKGREGREKHEQKKTRQRWISSMLGSYFRALFLLVPSCFLHFPPPPSHHHHHHHHRLLILNLLNSPQSDIPILVWPICPCHDRYNHSPDGYEVEHHPWEGKHKGQKKNTGRKHKKKRDKYNYEQKNWRLLLLFPSVCFLFSFVDCSLFGCMYFSEQEVYRVQFSPHLDGRHITSGMDNIIWVDDYPSEKVKETSAK